MMPVVAILEDDPGRIICMRECLADILPGMRPVFFENAQEMIDWLGQHLGQVVLISLDHDLPLRDAEGKAFDCGTGREVAPTPGPERQATARMSCQVLPSRNHR